MSIDQRGRNAVRGSAEPIDYRWGGLDPKENWGKVKLMEHTTYGQRYFRLEDVENRQGRGWVLAEYKDPTTPIADTPDVVVQVAPQPVDRPDVTEAAPASRAPRRKARK